MVGLHGYFARLERQGIGINLASYVGATTVREMVIGYADRAATPSELAQMQALVAEAMHQGAVGVSSSLEYAPAPYASTEELIALSRTAAQFGGIYATHMRSEQEALMTALEETIRIGREAHIPVEIWHLKAAAANNFGLMPEIVGRIDRARAAGIDIAADTYAYPAWANRVVRIHSALGARWRQRQAYRAAQGPGGAQAPETGAGDGVAGVG